jgi:hypothetical protein
MKQTAVEWLYVKMFEKKGRITKEEYDQAKQMEKEQMIEAFNNGMEYMWNNTDCENYKGNQYYKETYGE